MLTMTEIRQQSYKVFASKLGENVISRQESALKYIEHLGGLTGSDISSLTPLKTFGNKEGLLPVERNKINELFFSWLGAQNSAVPVEVTMMSDKDADAVAVKFDAAFKVAFQQILNEQNNEIDSAEGAVKQYSNELKARHQRLSRALILKDGLEKRRTTGLGIGKDLQELLSEGWWTLSDTPVKSGISLVSPNIVLSYKREKQAVMTAVNMGRYQANIIAEGSRMTVSIVKYNSNPVFGSSGYYHPHVQHNAKVCFGDMEFDAGRAMHTFNLKPLANILMKVLTNYNADSPYVQLHRFEEASVKGSVFRREKYLEDQKALREIFKEIRFTPPLSQASPVVVPPVQSAGGINIGDYFHAGSATRQPVVANSGEWTRTDIEQRPQQYAVFGRVVEMEQAEEEREEENYDDDDDDGDED